jgi:hypothetical protein
LKGALVAPANAGVGGGANAGAGDGAKAGAIAAGPAFWASVTMGVINAVAGYVPACATVVNAATGVDEISDVNDETAGESAENTDCSWEVKAVPSEDRPWENCDAKLRGAATIEATSASSPDGSPSPRAAGGTVNCGNACAIDCAPA